MNRNTLLFIIGLSIFATIVAGVNIARMTNPSSDNSLEQSEVTVISPTPTPSPIPEQFVSNNCGVTFYYAGQYNRVDIDNGGSTLSSSDGESLTLLCQANLPRPQDILDSETIIKVGSVSATLVQPVASESGSTRGRIFFRHPTNRKNVSISGSQQIFSQLLETLSFL